MSAATTRTDTHDSTHARARQVPLGPTSPTVYVTGRAALNIVADDDRSGDWHFRSTWFSNVGSAGQQRRAGADLAGDGQPTNTNPYLGTLGVRDVTQVLIEHGYHPDAAATPVYAANHLRALADWVYAETKSRGRPLRVNSEFNQWFGKAEMFDTFKRDYLEPLKAGMSAAELKEFEAWQTTLFWEQ